MSSARDFLFVKKNELVAKIFTDIMRAVAAVHDYWGAASREYEVNDFLPMKINPHCLPRWGKKAGKT